MSSNITSSVQGKFAPDPLRRSDYEQHFNYIQNVKQDISKFEAHDLKKLKYLRATNLVMQVFFGIFPILLSLSFMFTPVWVPYGIGVPVILILALVKAKLIDPRIELLEYQHNSLLFIQKMLKDSGNYAPENQRNIFKSLHPIGEWDLPAVFPQLKSDWMMKEELDKKHPTAAEDIERTIKSYNLEISPYVKCYAGKHLAQFSNLDKRWEVIKSEVIDVKNKLYNANYAAYEENTEKASLKSLDLPEHSAYLPFSSLKSSLQAWGRHYLYLIQVFEKAESTYKQLSTLYQNEPDKNPFTDSWKEFVDKTNKFWKKGGRIIFEFGSKSPKWIEIKLECQKNGLLEELPHLIDKAHSLQFNCKEAINQFPTNKVEEYQNELELLKISVDVLFAYLDESRKESGLDFSSFIATYFEKHPESKKLEKKTHDNVLKWLDDHPEFMGESESSLSARKDVMQPAVSAAITKLQAIKNELKTADIETSFQKIKDFETTEYKQARVACGYFGVMSHGTRFRRAVFRQLIPAAKPFEKIEHKVGEPQAIRNRKVEQKFINRHLLDVDKKMLWTNRGRKYGIQLVMAVAFIVEGIILLRISNPWINWGFTAGITLLQAASVLVDYRLRKMEEEKLSLKFQTLLANQPNIQAIAGNRQKLVELKRVQEKYHLDGVHVTWAKVLAKGDSALEMKDPSLIAKEASKMVTPYLEKEWVLSSCYADQDGGVKNEEDEIAKRIFNLKAQLSKETNQTERKKLSQEIERLDLLGIEVIKWEIKDEIDRLKGSTDKKDVETRNLLRKRFHEIKKKEFEQALFSPKKEVKPVSKKTVPELEASHLRAKRKALLNAMKNAKNFVEYAHAIGAFREASPLKTKLDLDLRNIDFHLDILRQAKHFIFEQRKEAEGNLIFLTNVYQFISFEPETLYSTLERKDRTFLEQLHLHIQYAIEKKSETEPLADADQIFKDLIQKLGEKQNINEECKKLETLPKSVLLRARRIVERCHQIISINSIGNVGKEQAELLEIKKKECMKEIQHLDHHFYTLMQRWETKENLKEMIQEINDSFDFNNTLLEEDKSFLNAETAELSERGFEKGKTWGKPDS